MKILLAVDGSAYSKRMLDYLAANNGLLGTGNTFLVFTAVTSIPPHAARFVDVTTLQDHYREQAEIVLQPIREFAAMQGWAAETAYQHGHAADAIAEFAVDTKPDLIVMGTHGHSAWGNVVLGSVVSGVLARSKVPVLLIR
ncbi:MAG: universal stress protein [Burkholderiales bacterium]